MKLKRRIFDIIQIGTRIDIPSTVFDIIIVILIITSIAVTFLQTFSELNAYKSILHHIEFATILVFAVEYLLRLWTCNYLYENHSLLRFIFSFYGIVDLLTIVSYFAPLYSNGFVALRMVRVIRILRLFRVNKNFDAFNIVSSVILEKRKQLASSIFMILMLLLASSLVMYGFENEAQPDTFRNGFSGIWWAVATVLTVGYGDIYPITVGGKIIAIVIAILGVCVVAIPTGILSAGFVDYYSNIRDSDSTLSKESLQLLQKRAHEAELPVDLYVKKMCEKEKACSPDSLDISCEDPRKT